MVENINWSSITSIKIGFEIYQGRSFKIVSRLLRWFDSELNGEYSFTNDLRYLIFDLKKFKLVVFRLCGRYNLYLEDFVELWLYSIGNKNNYLIKSPPTIIDKDNYGEVDFVVNDFSWGSNIPLYINFTTSEFGGLGGLGVLSRMYSNNITSFKHIYDVFCKEYPNWIWYLYLIGFPNIKPPQKT